MKFAGQVVIAVLILVLTHFVLMAQVTTITEADQFKAQCEADFQQANSLFEKLEKSTGPQTIETVLVPLNDLWLAMDRSGNLAAIYQQAHPDAQVYFMTGYSADDLLKKALENGAMGVFGKPIDLPKLLKMLERAAS